MVHGFLVGCSFLSIYWDREGCLIRTSAKQSRQIGIFEFCGRNIMGNFFGMMQQVVHPWSHEEQGWKKIPTASCSGVRIKVRMTTTELKELMATVDSSKGSSEMGRLIMRELSKGKYQARVVACGDLMMPVQLSSIREEEDDDKCS
ncbi:hypothetical protein PVL29_020103 [Vitis rotundifolia]|uniref:Uncharacterized protein n=1 Tax=Vitis rotundifolia TaxID=103349 RepID=A0AA39DG81_VITRO|nr:hypothetical protein PVL29_020103 [Vitis rotundifolia]